MPALPSLHSGPCLPSPSLPQFFYEYVLAGIGIILYACLTYSLHTGRPCATLSQSKSPQFFYEYVLAAKIVVSTSLLAGSGIIMVCLPSLHTTIIFPVRTTLIQRLSGTSCTVEVVPFVSLDSP